MKRRNSNVVYYNKTAVGGNNPITVQSMTNTDTRDVKKTISQIKKLEKAGCEIIRLAVPDKIAAEKLKIIKDNIKIPLIADIHFDFKLALKSINQSVDGIRINPGNIDKPKHIKTIVKAAKSSDIPIRVGVNSGSLEKKLLKKYGHPSPEALVMSALNQVKLLEKYNFKKIVISIKSSNIMDTINAHEKLAKHVNYPFHIGITEAGTPEKGKIKSAAGIGGLLTRGFGDTIRVSLTGNPLEEVKTGWNILEALSLRQRGPKIISCPTCGRTNIDLISLTKKVEDALSSFNKKITVAVMGCAVNGPGEAREADIGIAGGKNEGLIFKKGKLIKKTDENKLIDSLLNEINNM